MMFEDLGYSDGVRYAVGIIEIIGALLFAVPRFTIYVAGGLGAVMVGANPIRAYCRPLFEMLIPGQRLIVFAVIFVLRYKAFKRREKEQLRRNHVIKLMIQLVGCGNIHNEMIKLVFSKTTYEIDD